MNERSYCIECRLLFDRFEFSFNIQRPKRASQLKPIHFRDKGLGLEEFPP